MPTFRTWLNVRRRFLIPTALAVIFAFLFFGRSFFFQSLQFIQRPFVSLSTWISNRSNALFGSCFNKSGEYENVLKQRNQYTVDYTKMETLKAENETLKKELGFLQQRQLKGVFTRIIRRTVSNQTSTFVVDVGETDHIVLGSAVIVEDGMFVGKVTRVDQTQSVITASTDFQLATGVSLLNKTRTIGIAEGSFGNLIELKFIPSDEVIHANDLVVTSGLEDYVPSGLIVGIVNTVKPEPEAPFQHAIIEPLSDVRRYDHVIILTPTL